MRSKRFLACVALPLFLVVAVPLSCSCPPALPPHRGARAASNYLPGHRKPNGIASGPDGALWFTNMRSDSIGRITTSGVNTNYSGSGIDDPLSITAGPDGALWFTNHGADSIGRITTAGVVSNYTGRGIADPWGITTGPATRSLVHQPVETTRSVASRRTAS